MLTTAIYYIWKERNARLHTKKELEAIQIWKCIEIDFHILNRKASNNNIFSHQPFSDTNEQENYETSVATYLQSRKLKIDITHDRHF